MDIPPSLNSLIVVCPHCHYGFRDAGGPGADFVCPRKGCGHRWDAASETMQSVQGTARRKAISELTIVAGGAAQTYTLKSGETTIGRDAGCQIVLDNLTVSRRHATIRIEKTATRIEDLQSSCGTIINGKKIASSQELLPGDHLILGGTTLRFDLRYEALQSANPIADRNQLIEKASKTNVLFRGQKTDSIPLGQERITFGRGTDRNVVLPNSLISMRHAVLEFTNGSHYISDAQTESGTYVNGKPIIHSKLVSGDRIQIGPYLFRYEVDRLIRTEQSNAIALEVRNLSKEVGEATLLDNLTFLLKPGEFVGLIGPSGAGKTTLLDAMNGTRPATSGDVVLNDDSLYEEYARLRHHIGYVPQDDIIHRDLTVRQALTYAARLRLPADMTTQEQARIVNETLEMLDLSHRGEVLISHLSGGQRKRVSVGVELLNRPGVLFLDEPTSGLDPGTEAKLMNLFRRLADQGRTVICTTHVMENIDLFHKVVILAPGGKLAYFGPPDQAKQFFGIDKFCDLYDRIESAPPVEWQNKYRQSSLFKELVAPLLSRRGSGKRRSNRRLAPAQKVSWLGQCLTLMSRFIRLQWADRMNLAVMLAQPLLITGLICIVCKDVAVINFLLVISALWFGCSGAAQQIVKERPIYLRERMVNLRLDTYLFSKLLPLMVFTAFQSLLMLLVTRLFVEVPGQQSLLLMSFILASWNGVGLGLLISAASSNGDKAMSVVPLSLIPQIILAGVLVPLPEMNSATQGVSMLTAARWANQASEAIIFEDRSIDVDLLKADNVRPLWNLYPDEEMNTNEGRMTFLTDYRDQSVDRRYVVWTAFLMLTLFSVFMSGMTCWMLKQNDQLW